jgi:hypothetical protein
MVRAHAAPWLARHQAPRGGLAVLIGLAAAACTPAQAECRWVLVNGHQHELCDSLSDLSVLPPLPDLPSLPTLRPLLPLPSLPPLGTVECYQAEVQIGLRSQWMDVCPTDDGRLLLPSR